jgi:hypothetical protein
MSKIMNGISFKDTLCEATTFRGDSWDTAEISSSFSGTPAGVVDMVFGCLARQNPNAAEELLKQLQLSLEVARS